MCKAHHPRSDAGAESVTRSQASRGCADDGAIVAPTKAKSRRLLAGFRTSTLRLRQIGWLAGLDVFSVFGQLPVSSSGLLLVTVSMSTSAMFETIQSKFSSPTE
jgi:hypothetical protein